VRFLGLGDDTSNLMTIGFTPQQIAQIAQAYQSGALSPDGYQQLVSGTVDPSQLGDFLSADLGAQTGGGLPTWALALAAGLIFVAGFSGGYASPTVKVSRRR
jgi:hypothetical protein